MRDEKEGRKKQARSNKQTRQSNTAHPRQSLKMSCLGWDSNPRHYTLDRALYQLSYQGNLAGMYVYVYLEIEFIMWATLTSSQLLLSIPQTRLVSMLFPPPS